MSYRSKTGGQGPCCRLLSIKLITHVFVGTQEMYVANGWVLVPSSYKKDWKDRLLGSLLKSHNFKNLTLDIIKKKEVISPVSCISNDKKIIMELEAGSRRSHWKGNYMRQGGSWSSQGALGTLWRCSYSSLTQSWIPLEDGSKGSAGLQALHHFSGLQHLQLWHTCLSF